MSEKSVISFENVGKMYRLGEIGTGSMASDLNRFIAKVRGKEDPYAIITEDNDRSKKSDSKYVWALKDINFDIKEGEVVGIIGRNGAGKSTMLKLLSRVTLPSVGEIKVKGRIASLLEVGTGFHPDLSGRENVFLNGAILGMTKQEIKSKFDEIVDFSGVERYIDTPVKRYSSGMYVRLAFAVAAHLEPEILVVDEVLAVGDSEFQKKCLGKMKDVSKQGRTVLFVSHNMPSVRALCNKAMLLQKGRLTSYGNTQEIISEYFASDYVLRNNEDGTIPEKLSLHNTGEGRFTFVKIMDDEKQYKKEFYFKQKFSVHFKLDLQKDVENVSLSVFILNSYGENILMSTENETYKPTNLKKGISEFIVSFDERLMPGGYSVGLAVSYFHTGSSIDYVESVCDFKVIKETKEKDMEYPWATVHGYVLPKTTWKKIN
jgi:lipopolysaccharide transport system ATP-binding protein